MKALVFLANILLQTSQGQSQGLNQSIRISNQSMNASNMTMNSSNIQYMNQSLNLVNVTTNSSSNVNVSVNITFPNQPINYTNDTNPSVSANTTNDTASNSSIEKSDFVQQYNTTIILNLDQISIVSYSINQTYDLPVPVDLLYLKDRAYILYNQANFTLKANVNASFNNSAFCPAYDTQCYRIIDYLQLNVNYTSDQVRCLLGGNICFQVYPYSQNDAIINVGQGSMLVTQITQQAAWNTSEPIFWNNSIPYKLNTAVPNYYAAGSPYLNQMRLCFGAYECYNNVVPIFDFIDSKAIQCVQNMCFNSTYDNTAWKELRYGSQVFQAKPLSIIEAWSSPNIVLSNNLSRWQLNYPIKGTDAPDIVVRGDIGICLDQVCWMKLKIINVADPFSLNSTALISDNTYFIGCVGTACFSGVPYDYNDQILQIDNLSYFVHKLNFEDGFNSNGTVFWIGHVIYQALTFIPNNNFSTMQYNLSDPQNKYCRKNTCYKNLHYTDVISPIAKNDSVICLQQSCYTYDLDDGDYSIAGIDDITILVEKSAAEEAFTSGQSIIWNGTIPYYNYGQIPDNNYSDIQFNINNVFQCQGQSNCQINLQRTNQTQKKNSSLLCFGPACYNYQQMQGQLQIASVDINAVLMRQVNISEAYVSNQTIFWIDNWTPYLFYGSIDSSDYTSMDDYISLERVEVCYGQQYCIKNLIQVDVPSDDGSYFYIGDNIYSGDVDYNTYKIFDIDNVLYEMQLLNFIDGWNSNNQTIWYNNDFYQINRKIESNQNFSQVKLKVNQIVICDRPGQCYLTKDKAPKPNSAQVQGVKCIQNKCYKVEYYTRNEKVICVSSYGQNIWCNLNKLLDDSNLQTYPIVTQINTTKYLYIQDVSITLKPDIQIDLENLTQCYAGDGCYKNFVIVSNITLQQPNQRVSCPVQGPFCIQSDLFEKFSNANIIKKSSKRTNIVKLSVINLNKNDTIQDFIGEKLRQNFRDYFLYAIQGKTSDARQEGYCNSDCFSRKDSCCTKVTATDLKSGLIVYDKLCMKEQIVNSWSNISLDQSTYSMECSSDRVISGAIERNVVVGFMVVSVLANFLL